MSVPRRVSSLAGAVLVAVLLAAGCGTTPAEAPETDPTAVQSGYPKVIDQGGAEPVTIEAEPQRIAALSPDVAEAALELIGPERLVAVPRNLSSPSLGNHVEDAASVPEQLAPGNDPDPDQVLSYEPDLILLTPRHEGEQDAASVLGGTGIPVLAMEHWDDLDDIAANLMLLGEALDAEEQAESLVEEMNLRRDAVADAVADLDRPSVLALSNQAGTPFVIGPDAFTSALIELGGGESAAEAAGVRATGPADPELIVSAEPDAILLVDVKGSGRDSFDAVLENPAVADLPAMTEDRVLILPAASALATGITHTLDGLEELAGWLHPDALDHD
ncbi:MULTISPECIES: ABC transporter substrate-binding protein [Actinoalloteichus]|uniref:ABC-type Fe3+-hydroxamate transport system, periplasmic component n=1 Tax=Actinoalloteichus fjordicus TaxID=1612552 RepID=A0AAC9LD12_9PSEU|nr:MULTISPECIES: ABC transporter substrate-binding protein [Actinoalloteichus]APU15372.1 ABC-type Fe3+-hydroxamate transport system, periplasmic component [Actinoalloteichus fjordicus]APU21439.1 ABC-type Fe3+-hydroxamate transport system, periplasmic component [Actinoalloteichus sp. GBA129-24]